MTKIQKTFIGIVAFCSVFLLSQAANAQAGYQEFTGNLTSFNGPQVRTAFFTLRIKNLTSDEQANQDLAVLQDSGQDSLLSSVRKEDVGTFSVDNQLARTVNVVRESDVDGKKRIFVVFERWTQFAEVRGGYRSLDYPFGVIELMVDPNTGKGDGTYIAAAQIRWKTDKKTSQNQVEIENFATYPAKLTNVQGKIRGGAR